MIIAHVTPNFPPAAGGIGRHVSAVAKQQSKLHEVHVIVSSASRRPLRVLRHVNMHDVPAQSQSELLAFDSNFPDRVEVLLDKIRPDVVHAHHLRDFRSQTFRRAKRFGARLFLTVHDLEYYCPTMHGTRPGGEACSTLRQPAACLAHCGAVWGPAFADSSQSSRLGLPNWGLLRRMAVRVASRVSAHGTSAPAAGARASEMQLAARNQDILQSAELLEAAIVPSTFVKGILNSWGFPRPVVRLPHGVEPLGADWKPRRTVGAPYRFGFIGAASWLKGIDLAVSALAKLSPLHATLSVHGSGDPRLIADVLRLAPPGMALYRGPFESKHLDKRLGEVDAVVVPSRALETFSLIVHECLLRKIPVIVSERGALPEALQHGGGLIVPSDDVEGLAAAMRAVAAGAFPPFSGGVRTIPEYAQHLEEVYCARA